MELLPNAKILRPSLVFGNEDRFFNRYASMSSFSIILPVIGDSTRFQPVYVDDLAKAAEKVLIDKRARGVFEIGGPEVLTHRETIEKMLEVVRRKRLIIKIPFKMAALMAKTFGYINFMTLGLIKPPFTEDNVRELKSDNVVGEKVKSLKDLKIKPKTVDSIIPTYLYAYRPYGQYNRVNETSEKT